MGRESKGFTLLELLAVIIIFSMMIGFSVYFLRGAGKDLGVDAAANQVAAQLSAAHQLSRSQNAPAAVIVDAKANTIAMLLRETVGEWHFEDPQSRGAFGKDCRIQGGSAVPGKVGQGIRLTGSASIQCMEVPVFAPDQGFALELWFKRQPGRGRGRLASIGTRIEVFCEPDGSFSARAGGLQVSSGNARLPLEAWCHVQLVHSGRDLRLILNRNAFAPVPGRMEWGAAETLLVGDPKTGPSGVVDEVRLSLVLPRDTFTLPAEASFELPASAAPATELVISFDSEGRLEAPAPVKLAIKSAALRREVTVGLAGNVQRD